eukprot:TRINITY_DN6988_c0_g1_i9.p2 TRINITY_DN6988_c0_g1~~TRINITY_DN6988_c0_g1_i9.p2  ORF type:complete len:113 (+),score=12.23 TRINITY_DN6988_c0_g1_i9:213-551(+)
MGNAPTELLPDWMRNDNESEGSSSDKALDHCVPTFPLNERISQLWRVYDTGAPPRWVRVRVRAPLSRQATDSSLAAEQTGWLALIPARRAMAVPSMEAVPMPVLTVFNAGGC